jgi:hypothetical protein
MKTSPARRTAAVIVVALCILVGRAAKAQTPSCTIAFSDPTGMSILPYTQAYGFAQSPWYYNWCSALGVWFYVDEDSRGGPLAGHYHFWADDPSVNCVTTNSSWPNGVMGRQVGYGPCNAVDPIHTSRQATPHDPGYMIRIQNLSTSQSWRATQITVRSGPPVRVLLQNTDGTFWQYTNLTPGVWNLLPNGHNAIFAWVMNQNSTPVQPITFDNFVVQGLF